MRAPLRCARAYGVRKNLSSVVYGTTSQPSDSLRSSQAKRTSHPSKPKSGLPGTPVKSCPDTCVGGVKRVGHRESNPTLSQKARKDGGSGVLWRSRGIASCFKNQYRYCHGSVKDFKMTLNITVVSPLGIHQSADFRISKPRKMQTGIGSNCSQTPQKSCLLTIRSGLAS
jgi:hypothetical protein